MNVESVLKVTAAAGGGTFERSGRLYRPAGGYMVGAHPGTYRIVPADDVASMAAALADVLRDYPGAMVGTWLQGTAVHVDPVLHVADLVTAVTIGRRNGQLAIWDVAAGTELPLDGYVANLVTAYAAATPDELRTGRDWYPAAARMVRTISRRTGIGRRRVALAVAALSPRNPWRWNIQDTAALATFVTAGAEGTPPSVTTFNGNRDLALRYLQGAADWSSSAPKVRSFVANIMGDTTAVTVDVHATRCATGGTLNHPRTDREYDAIAEAYRIVAAAVGETPRELQAVLWLVAIRQHGRIGKVQACKRGTFDYIRRAFGETVEGAR